MTKRTWICKSQSFPEATLYIRVYIYILILIFQAYGYVFANMHERWKSGYDIRLLRDPMSPCALTEAPHYQFPQRIPLPELQGTPSSRVQQESSTGNWASSRTLMNFFLSNVTGIFAHRWKRCDKTWTHQFWRNRKFCHSCTTLNPPHDPWFAVYFMDLLRTLDMSVHNMLPKWNKSRCLAAYPYAVLVIYSQ